MPRNLAGRSKNRVAVRERHPILFALDSGAVLHLASETSADWLPRVQAHLAEVLLDHAHCEKKAAGAAIKLLFSYPHHRFLVAAEARHHGIYLELASELTNRDTLDARLLELARA